MAQGKIQVHEIPVNIGEGYTVITGKDLLPYLQKELTSEKDYTRVVIISSPKISNIYFEEIERAIREVNLPYTAVMFPDGERYKNFLTVKSICDRMVQAGADRTSVVLAFGGGMIGDIAGFVASIYMRGIPFIQIPTTLVAQVDASIGGKTGFNMEQGKNLLGTFYQPHLVLCDMSYLETLSQEEYKNGLAEILKYGMICDANLFRYIERNTEAINNREEEALAYLIKRSVMIKSRIVAQDVHDKHLRQVLNFGHTVGHAIEAATSYQRFKHGYCVCVGMVAASSLAYKMKLFRKSSLKRLEDLLDELNLPRALDEVDISRIMEHIEMDKKNKGRSIRMVLPRAIGRVELHDDIRLDLLRQAIHEVIVNFSF